MTAEQLVVIPDSHGHVAKVERLVHKLRRLGYLHDRKLLFLGDYIDRGPDAKALVDYCVGLKAEGHVLLSGNHEYVLNRVLARGPDHGAWVRRWGANYEDDTLASYGLGRESGDWQDKAELLSGLMPESHKTFFTSLPLFYEGENIIAVHAGPEPAVPWTQQAEYLAGSSPNGVRGPSQLFSHELAVSKINTIGKYIVSGHASRIRPFFECGRVLLDCGVDAGGPLVAWIGGTDQFVSE